MVKQFSDSKACVAFVSVSADSSGSVIAVSCSTLLLPTSSQTVYDPQEMLTVWLLHRLLL